MNGDITNNPFSNKQLQWLNENYLSMSDVQNLAFRITSGFEGSGYATINNTDAGILSYGRFQFTLASGSLVTLIDNYLSYRGLYVDDFDPFMSRLHSGDRSLKNDRDFISLLKQAATDPDMQRVQNDLAFVKYYAPAMEKSVRPRFLVMPLSMCFAFDCAINHGLGHPYFTEAESKFGLTPKQSLKEKHVWEGDFILAATFARLEAMTAFAKAHNLDGVRVRAKFWHDRALAQDWYLRGDNDELLLKTGLVLKV